MRINRGVILDLMPAVCCICGSGAGTACLKGYDQEFRTCDNIFIFLKCSGCGHVFLSPRPKADDLQTIYSDYLTSNRESAYYPSWFVALVKDHLFNRQRMKYVVRSLKEGANILDTGAGSGRLLKFLEKVTDVPINLYANDIYFPAEIRKELNHNQITVLECSIEDCRTSTMFDAITCVHVIEHVFDPIGVLRWINAHLKRDGVLYLETPDVDALLKRIFKSNWGHTHFPRHFNLFSKAHLKNIVFDAGFRVIQQKNTTSAPAWNMSIRNFLGLDALKKHGISDIFNYTNPITLGIFSLVDLFSLFLGISTSTQCLTAQKV